MWQIAALGGLQTLGGMIGMNKLQKQPFPTFTEDPAMAASRARAEQMASQGFTDEEIADYELRQARLSNTRYNKALASGGGNLASSINAGINYGDIGSNLAFASRGADLKRRNIRYADGFSQNLQNLRNQNTSNAVNYRLQSERALGGAIQAGLNNIVGGVAGSLGTGEEQTGTQGGASRWGYPRGGFAQPSGFEQTFSE